MTTWRRIADHPTTRVALLILAGAQAMIGAFVLGLAVNIGTSAVRTPGAGVEVDRGPIPLDATPVAGIGVIPQSITVTADGSLWFVTSNPSAIGRIDAAGSVARFPTRLPWALGALTPGRDGGVWFADPAGLGIGYVTSSGAMARHGIAAAGSPQGVAAGPDGLVWFTVHAEGGDWIGRMTPTGDVTRFLIPRHRRNPGPIVAGPDGNMWFATPDSVWRITPGGELTEVDIGPTAGVPSLAAGPDKAIWFARNTPAGGASVGRIETGRQPKVTAVYDLPGGAVLGGIVAGADGNLWVAEQAREAIARVTPRGQVTQFTLAPGQYPATMVAGRGGELLFTFNSAGGTGGVARFDVLR